MTPAAWGSLAAVVAAVLLTAPPLARYMQAVYERGPAPGDRLFAPIERLTYRVCGVDPDHEQRWFAYAMSVMAFGAVSVLVLYLIMRLQGVLPGNPTRVTGMEPGLAFNTAISFVTGTNWQAYAGENGVSLLAGAAGLVVAQFTAAGVSAGVALALVRALRGRTDTVGNFWRDLVRTILRVMLPISIVASLVLVSQGSIQNLRGFTVAHTVEHAVQVVPGGPVASMEAIKLLGNNGGGPFATNSAHPFENPNGLTNAFELYLAVLLPFAFAFLFGRMVGRPRQGQMIALVLLVVWLVPVIVGMAAEARGNPVLQVAAGAPAGANIGNLEGKEVRLGAAGSALLAVGTMGGTTGVASSALDSYTAVGGGSALVAILLGEIGPGGIGSGLYGVLLMILVTVFIAGLMIGRTPEFLGKRVSAQQMKFIAVAILAPAVVIIGFAAAAVVIPDARDAALNPGPHGFTEILYAYASATNGNGSAFAGLAANSDWYNTTLGLAMLLGRYAVIVPVLAVAGSFAPQRVHPTTPGTLGTTSPTFVTFVLAVVVIIGGLSYLAGLALGPIAEALSH